MAAQPETPPQSQQTVQEAESHGAPSAVSTVDTIPFWEWLVAYVGLVLVLGSIGFLLYQAIAGDTSPPQVAVRLEAIRRFEHGYLVQIRAMNHGGSTAANVIIEGVLTHQGSRVESSQTLLDYVPARSYQKGGLFFTHDPQQYHLQLRATGYIDP